MQLQKLGYVVELLRGPWTCFDANQYGSLIISDIEETIATEEVNKLESDVRDLGLSLLVVADWYDEMSLLRGSFFDDNTHSQWFPVTGGCNIPALNTLLDRFGMQLGVQAFSGNIEITRNHKVFHTMSRGHYAHIFYYILLLLLPG
jgi:membrane-bound transcription factor site-1 protease